MHDANESPGGRKIRIGLSFLLLTPWTAALAETAGSAWFIDVADDKNLRFVHDPAVGGKYFMPESIGAGCAFLDYDGDGDLDVYLPNGAHADGAAVLRNRLFRQEADGRFRDVTVASGLGDPGYGMGIAVGDVDRDGDVDVYVTNYGRDALYRNDGDGTFTDVTEPAGVDNPHWGASAVFLDVDSDRDLDLYVANYLRYSPPMACADFAGRPDYCGPGRFSGVSDQLYRNDGGGKLTDISRQAGISRAAGRGLGVVSADFNGDGRADLYVANDGQPNHLWLNRGTAFEDDALLMGVAVNALGRPEAGMGVALGDTEGDGGIDLFVTHLRTETNTFYKAAGDLGFVDATAAAGLGGPSYAWTGFGTGFFDADNDGDLDLAVVNGRVYRGPLLTGRDGEPSSSWAPYAEPNVLFQNDGHGRFEDVSSRAGALSSQVDNSRGLALGDVDDDGGVDLLVSNGGGPARLLQNTIAPAKSWLGVRVLDPVSGSDAIGASVTVVVPERASGATVADGKRLYRTVSPGYSYLSSSDPRVHFGLNRASVVDEVSVRWNGGETRRIKNLPVNRWIVVTAR